MTGPTPGRIYSVRDGAGGLLTLAGRAYGVGAGSERLRLAQRINAHPLNRRFRRAPGNDFERRYFPDGLVSMSPRFECRGHRGRRCHAELFIPPWTDYLHPRLGPLIPLPPGRQDEFRTRSLFDLACLSPCAPDLRTVLDPEDERIPLNASIYPNRFICMLSLVIRVSGRPDEVIAGSASGLRIGPNHILTAAHALYASIPFELRRNRVREIGRTILVGIAFGRDGLLGDGSGTTSQGAFYASDFWIPPEWIARVDAGDEIERHPHSNAFDYALIRFSDGDREPGIDAQSPDTESWLDAPATGISDHRGFWNATRFGQTLEARGYPCDKPCTLWSTAGEIFDMRSVGRRRHGGAPRHAWLLFDADSQARMSGAPVWRERTLRPAHKILEPSRQRVLCGVATSADHDEARNDSVLYAAALTPFVWQRLRAQGVPV